MIALDVLQLLCSCPAPSVQPTQMIRARVRFGMIADLGKRLRRLPALIVEKIKARHSRWRVFLAVDRPAALDCRH